MVCRLRGRYLGIGAYWVLLTTLHTNIYLKHMYKYSPWEKWPYPCYVCFSKSYISFCSLILAPPLPQFSWEALYKRPMCICKYTQYHFSSGKFKWKIKDWWGKKKQHYQCWWMFLRYYTRKHVQERKLNICYFKSLSLHFVILLIPFKINFR